MGGCCLLWHSILVMMVINSHSTQQYQNANNYSSHYYNENTDYYQSKFSTASLKEKKEREGEKGRERTPGRHTGREGERK